MIPKLLALPLILVGPPFVGAGDTPLAPKSPEAVFHAVQARVSKDDLAGVMSHLTRDSQQLFVGTFAFWGHVGKEGGLTGLREVVEKHGMTEQAVKDAMAILIAPDGDSTKNIIKGMLILGAPIKDKVQVVKVACTFLRKELDTDGDLFSLLPKAATLKTVFAGDETARANVVEVRDGMERTVSMYFRKEGGLWKVDLVKQLAERGIPR